MNINEYLDNVRKIRKFAEERWGKSETTYARGYNYAMETLELSPTKETYNRLMVEQDDQVNRNDFDRGIKAYLDQYEFKEDTKMTHYYESIQWDDADLHGTRYPYKFGCETTREIRQWEGLYYPKASYGKVAPEFESSINSKIKFINSITDVSGKQVIFQTAEDCIDWIKENIKEEHWPSTEIEKRIERSAIYLK